MDILVICVCVFTLFILTINGVEISKWKLSREDVDEIEKQIQLRKNNTIKTIRTHHGDIYACMDLYKQPAFDHPLLKNHNLTLTPQKRPTLSHEKPRNKFFDVETPKLGLSGGGCPDGTVPIKKVTKEDLIRGKLSQMNDDVSLGFRHARCTASESTGYLGVSATLTYYNPNVDDDQYSAAKMKLQFGPDSIEAGWRVDPKLNGDHKTRLYIRTDTRSTHCFNDLCPGFILTQKDTPLNYAFEKVSTVKGDKYAVDISITHNQETQRWILKIDGDFEIGYWPVSLFEHPGAADSVEWGGEVFGPNGKWRPGMGSGEDLSQDTDKDAYFMHVKVIPGPISGAQPVDPIQLQCKGISVYEVFSEGNVGDNIQYLIFYGGPIERAA